MSKPDFDVIVVGGGPGGATAALKSAKLGLKTALLERRELTRDKCCSGIVMTPMAWDNIVREYGECPSDFLAEPPQMIGYSFYILGETPKNVYQRQLVTWRKNLDSWMSNRALEAGADVRANSRVSGVRQEDGICYVTYNDGTTDHELTARVVIGADGCKSTVSASIFPDLQGSNRSRFSYRRAYEGELKLDKRYWHWFYFNTDADCICLHHKDGHYLVEGRWKDIGEEKICAVLAPFGFDLKFYHSVKPAWRDGAMIYTGLEQDVMAGKHKPALGNVLLVGDAGSLRVTLTAEGIATAIESGILAAISAAEAIEGRKEAAGVYLKALEPLVAELRIHQESRELFIKDLCANRGPEALNTMIDGWSRAVHIESTLNDSYIPAQRSLAQRS